MDVNYLSFLLMYADLGPIYLQFPLIIIPAFFPLQFPLSIKVKCEFLFK